MSSATRSRGVPASKMYGAITHIASSRVIVDRAPSAAPTSFGAGTAVTAAAGGAAEDQRAHARRVVQRQLLRDHPAHRRAEHVRRRDAGGVHHRRRILGHRRGIEYGPGGTSLRPTPRLS